MSAIERRILARLAKGPEHSTNMKVVKGHVKSLVERGLARRFTVPPATVPLWVEITDAGRRRLTELRTRELAPKPPKADA